MSELASSSGEPVVQLHELLEKYRYFNVEVDWWDWQYEDFTEQMGAIGITVDKINFSGFYSQGDGACFTGHIYRTEMKQFMEAHNLAERYLAAFFFASRDELQVNIVSNSHHHCHENTVNVNVDDEYLDYSDFEDNDPRGTIYQAMRTAYYKDALEFEEEVQEICRSYMKQLYIALRDEYEYLTSDECVLEAIKLNNLIEEK